MNEKLTRLREQYEEIQPSEELKQRSRKILEGEMPEHREEVKPHRNAGRGHMAGWKKWVATAAAVAVVFTGGLNTSESFAAAVSSLPGMEGLVKVLTLDRYHFAEGNMTVDVVIPQIEGLADAEIQEKINAEIRKDGEAVIAQFEQDMADLKEMGIEDDTHMGLEFNYDILVDTEDLLVVDTYLYNVVGSSSTIHKYYTVDRATGTLLTLPELMKDHPNYVSELSEYILSEMERANASGEGAYFTADNADFAEDAFTQIDADQLFYTNADHQLVICFDKYEVAPGAYGSPEFVIPADYFLF